MIKYQGTDSERMANLLNVRRFLSFLEEATFKNPSLILAMTRNFITMTALYHWYKRILLSIW